MSKYIYHKEYLFYYFRNHVEATQLKKKELFEFVDDLIEGI